MLVRVEQIVRADDRRIASDIALSDPAALEERDVADAVLAGEIEGGGEAVPAATDDDHVIGALRLRLAPCGLPAFVAGEAVPEHRPDRIFRHVPRRSPRWPSDSGGARRVKMYACQPPHWLSRARVYDRNIHDDRFHANSGLRLEQGEQPEEHRSARREPGGGRAGVSE